MRLWRPFCALPSWRLAASLALVVGGACAPTAPAPARLVIAHELWAGYFPLDAATLQQTLSLTLQTVVREDSDALFAEFAGGAYDGLAASLVDLLRVQQVVPGLLIIGCTDESDGSDAVVARASVQEITGLRGLRVGVMRGSFAEMLVRQMLRSAGLSIRDVQLVDVDASEAPRLLREGMIDAAETWEPYLSELGGPQFRTLYSTRETPGLVIQCIAMREHVVREQPAAVRELVARVVAVGTAAVPEPDSLRSRAARAVARDVASMPPVRGIRWLSLAENRRLLGADGPPELPKVATDHIRFLAESGLLRSPPDVARMITPGFLPR